MLPVPSATRTRVEVVANLVLCQAHEDGTEFHQAPKARIDRRVNSPCDVFVNSEQYVHERERTSPMVRIWRVRWAERRDLQNLMMSRGMSWCGC